MSAPAWLLDVINTTMPKRVPTVPNPGNHSWVQGDSLKVLINRSVVSEVPLVPSVPKEIQSSSDGSEIVDMQGEYRYEKVLSLLEGKRFALFVDDGKTNPVVATIGIQNVAIFALEIPQHSYDGIVLLELIEKYYGDNYAKS